MVLPQRERVSPALRRLLSLVPESGRPTRAAAAEIASRAATLPQDEVNALYLAMEVARLSARVHRPTQRSS
ncbi:MAG TPA: hypothetical protein VFX49_02040 [Chloroflexota bacterium]|nr:hypothetical protein [Chloroflexota bacterium]